MSGDSGRFEPDEEQDYLARKVIGAAIEVHRRLGPGFLESVYEEAMVVELRLQNIAFTRQAPVSLLYKGYPVGEGRLDLLIHDCLIVELKTVDELGPIHKAQLLSYLRMTRIHLGLLINFNETVLKNGIQRVVLSHINHSPPWDYNSI
jgi:GxxExxY protein